jgi:CRISPR-associated protein Cmr3
MTQYLNIIPKDTVISRDGRPFSNGGRMKSLNWFYPSVVAGTVRTTVAYQNKFVFTKDEIEKLKSISVKGPFPNYKNSLYFPAPLDCVLKSRTEQPFIARPAKLEENCYTDLPNGLIPVTINSDEEFKPCSNPPAFWKQDIMVDWLCENYDDIEDDDFNFVPFNSKSLNKEEVPNKDYFLTFPQQNIRTHIKIDKDSQTTEEGMLFQTTGLEFDIPGFDNFSDKILMSVKVDTDYTIQEMLATMGGERRSVCIKPNTNINWNCPDKIIQNLNNSKLIRMVLATPAIFKDGWKPGWLNEELEGSPVTGIKLKLKSAIIDRWQPVSGWDLENKCPKPVRRMVPAGSVYFFEVIEGNAQELSKLWLNSVCDDEQDKKDGFGLALFGIYK